MLCMPVAGRHSLQSPLRFRVNRNRSAIFAGLVGALGLAIQLPMVDGGATQSCAEPLEDSLSRRPREILDHRLR